jgi:peptidylprolyl isomerase
MRSLINLVGLVAATAVSIVVTGVTPAADQARSAAAAPAPPVLVLETAKGTIEIELAPAEAPKTVEQVLRLVRKGFYRGLRFHRVQASLVQIGDPRTRDMSGRDSWGNQSSGSPVGVAEISKRLKHVRGTVAMANSGDPAYSDSQFYIMKTPSPSLDGKYTIIGHVTTGMAVVDKIEAADILKNIYVKGEGPK